MATTDLNQNTNQLRAVLVDHPSKPKRLPYAVCLDTVPGPEFCFKSAVRPIRGSNSTIPLDFNFQNDPYHKLTHLILRISCKSAA